MYIQTKATGLFLTKDQADDIVKTLNDGRTHREVGRILFGERPWIDIWVGTSVHLHKQISEFLQSEMYHSRSKVLEKYDNFNFTGESARKSLLDLLHAYCLDSKSATISPVAYSRAAAVHNKICLGRPWSYLLAEEVELAFDITQRSKVAKLFQSTHDMDVGIKIDEAKAIRGSLSSFSVQIREIEMIFTKFVSFRISY